MTLINLLNLEYLKFRKNVIINLLFLFFVIFFPSTLFTSTQIKEVPDFLPGNFVFFEFPTVWDYMGYAGNWLVFFFLGVLAIYLVTTEVANKTMRQNIICGLTREKFFLSKYAVIVVLAIFATLYYTIITVAAGVYNAGSFSYDQAFSNDMAIPRFFLMSFSYLNFALFIAFLFRKSGLAVFFYLTYVLVIELILRWVVHYKIHESGLINYYPMNATEDLMPFPLFYFAEAIPNQTLPFSFLLSYGEAAMIASIYAVIFLIITYRLFMHRDI